MRTVWWAVFGLQLLKTRMGSDCYRVGWRGSTARPDKKSRSNVSLGLQFYELIVRIRNWAVMKDNTSILDCQIAPSCSLASEQEKRERNELGSIAVTNAHPKRQSHSRFNLDGGGGMQVSRYARIKFHPNVPYYLKVY